ncbi:uncharacterized protein isoform X3 [Musca autumnalis]|uniref:uncharacterized protein isoform X3 n=1 Tax=Musca autumnalis TaxID=221902 RepID=UPI003CE7D646
MKCSNKRVKRRRQNKEEEEALDGQTHIKTYSQLYIESQNGSLPTKRLASRSKPQPPRTQRVPPPCQRTKSRTTPIPPSVYEPTSPCS